MPKWPPKIGVTVGKFKPFHLGHELMIQMAAQELDELTVIVSDDTQLEIHEEPYIPLQFRYAMVKEQLKRFDNVRVVKHHDEYGDAKEYDEHGTAVDEGFWDYWTSIFNVLAPDATYFVSSDRYGQEAARRLSLDAVREVQWFPVDPDRELVNISATEIREDPIKNWRYITKPFRQRFGKRVLIIGPESSGKTTLTRELGRLFSSPAVPEYGRILSEVNNNLLDPAHFHEIAKRHHDMELFAIQNSETGLMFSDTDVYTTYLFSEIYLDEPIEKLKMMHTPNWYSLVVMLPPEIAWDDDGTRVIPDQDKRELFMTKLRRAYSRHRNVIELDGVTDLEERVRIVGAEVAKMMSPTGEDKYKNLTSECKAANITL